MRLLKTYAALVAAVIAAALAVAVLLIDVARADEAPACMPRPMMIAVMEKMGRVSVASGLDGRGIVVEVFTSPDGSFAVTATQTNGVTCLISMGDGWETSKAGSG